MAKFNLRRYDTQARFALMLGAVAVLLLIGQIIVTFNVHKGFQGFDRESRTLIYGPTRGRAIQAATLLTLAAAAAAVGFGFNSAGQRRNDRQGLSWTAFFLGMSVVCLAIIVYMFFRLRGEPMVILS